MTKFDLVGVNSNAFSIMGYVRNAMRKSGFSQDEINNYSNECMRGDYDDLLAKSFDMIDECNDRLGLKDAEDDLDDWNDEDEE